MGLLVDGEWADRWYDTSRSGGRFVRQDSRWRESITVGGRFPVEAGRYHLYVAWACPWAHRTLLARTLMGLEDAIDVSFVQPEMLEEGWTFDAGHVDQLYGLKRLYELYLKDSPTATTRVIVPVLWDKKAQAIVNNESSEIIRMLWGPMASLGRPGAPLAGHDLRPPALVEELDRVNKRVYETVNNGVYRCGFATTQGAYNEAVAALFDSLDWLEAHLARRRWLVGDAFTEADLRLFPTLVRFDPVYHSHFKCSRRALREYPNLWAYTRDIYQLPGVSGTVKMPEVRRHYFYSHDSINPHRIVPVAPWGGSGACDLGGTHARGQLGGLRGR